MSANEGLVPVIGLLVLMLLAEPALSEECPRTIGANKVFAEPWPQADTWFGSDSLAVILPQDGVWPTTAPNALIAVKLFWWSAGFEPRMESNLKVRIKRLDNGENDAVVSRTTNAHADSLGGWTMLTGIDFRSAGCWEITGEFLGQSLTFIVETAKNVKRLDTAT